MLNRASNVTKYVLICLLVIVAVIFQWTLTPKGAATSPDSLYYLNVAQHISQGLGVVETNFDLDVAAPYKPMTSWPPLYPVVLSSVMGTDADPEMAAKYLGILLFALSVLIFAVLATQIVGVFGGILASLFLMLQVPVFAVYTYAWSEVLFVPLVLLAYALAAHGYFASQRDVKLGRAQVSAVFAVLALIAACYTRYIGLVFAPPLLWTIYLSMEKGKRGRYVVGMSLLMLLSMLPLFVRNYLLTGSISGVQRALSDQSFWMNLHALGKVFGLHLLHFDALQFVTLIGGSVVAAIYVFRIRKAEQRSYVENRYEIGAITLPLVWLVSYLGALVFLSTWKAFDPIDTRLVSVAFPFLLLFGLGIVGHLGRSEKYKMVLLPIAIWVVFQAGYGLTVYKETLRSWLENGEPMFLASEGVHYNNFTANPGFQAFHDFFKLLKKSYPSQTIYFDGKPMLLHHLTGANVKTIPGNVNAEMLAKMGREADGQGVLLVSTNEMRNAIQAIRKANANSFIELPEFRSFGVQVFALPLPEVVSKSK
ncbi:hypothetical protein [Sulfurimicrobium lacus]|uniref:hypothetical protein n=1 Tax=Sulfurimicrobium lacus TaxID=2715678 RepID=UPI001564968F|nr:hypothetical protein [Sulfurimicrobium lacus]